MIFAGVRAGAARPYHEPDSNPGWPDSASVGTSGRIAMRCVAAIPTGRRRPALMCPMKTPGFANRRSASLLISATVAGPAPL